MGFQDYIENQVSYVAGTPFAGILGDKPSQGARSPFLWNSAFVAHGLNKTMLPLDVVLENLKNLLEELDRNFNFIGGAIAAPHKETVAVWLGRRVAEGSSKIGSVNCLYRGNDGRLWGTNTDGEGAVICLKRFIGDLTGKSILLLGPGGAGKAITAFSSLEVGEGGQVTLAARNPGKISGFADKTGARIIAWDNIPSACPATDVLINCTTLGSIATIETGLSPVSTETLACLPETAFIYDIIYDPSPTQLIIDSQNRDLATLGGSGMNLEQAILGFAYASAEPNGGAVTRKAMEETKLSLDQ
jgi:shikimate dehydrogenase